MSTNTTHGEFSDILAVARPELQPVCESLRRMIVSLHKGFVEVVWPSHRIASYGIGPKKMTEHYAYIAVQKSHVNWGFYYGALLTDPSHLLEGTGKKLRHIKLTEISSVERPAVIALLMQAIKERERDATDA